MYVTHHKKCRWSWRSCIHQQFEPAFSHNLLLLWCVRTCVLKVRLCHLLCSSKFQCVVHSSGEIACLMCSEPRIWKHYSWKAGHYPGKPTEKSSVGRSLQQLDQLEPQSGLVLHGSSHAGAVDAGSHEAPTLPAVHKLRIISKKKKDVGHRNSLENCLCHIFHIRVQKLIWEPCEGFLPRVPQQVISWPNGENLTVRQQPE